MDTNVAAFLFAVGAVVLAEMGDKTQLLAMAFATKYKASKVMIGVLVATILNHGLAVLVGNYITHISSAQVYIQGIASLSFILFGLWTIRGDKLNGEENRVSKFGPIMTVGIGFFIAEMGDKTQLATVALAAKFPSSPLGILTGTTTGMLIADGIGIIIGVVLCKRIPERIVKMVSAFIFMLFGFIGVYQVANEDLGFNTWILITLMTVLIALTLFVSYILIKKGKADKSSNETVGQFCATKIDNEA